MSIEITTQSKWPDWMHNCARCGADILDGMSRPATTREDEDGELELYSFCDADCRSAWDAGTDVTDD